MSELNKLPQIDLNSLEEYEKFITENLATVIYFSTPQCNVCKVLKPKLKELLKEEFPEIKFGYVNCEEAKELAAQKNVFAVPTIQFLFDGREFIRESRNINLNTLSPKLERPYSMIFE
jgi:thioredoxin-like negative regulator of GroEL